MYRTLAHLIACLSALVIILVALGQERPREKHSRDPRIPYLPTPQEVVERMLELAATTKTDVVYDLGCGDGRIVVTAAKKYGCKAIGVDIDPKRVEESMENARRGRVSNLVTIRRADLFQVDLSPASVVTLYLGPTWNVRLIPQLQKLKPGSRIVSHAFDMKGVKPTKLIKVKSAAGSEHKLYLWTTPLVEQPGENQ
jgi:precorrin-6B methylase 2